MALTSQRSLKSAQNVCGDAGPIQKDAATKTRNVDRPRYLMCHDLFAEMRISSSRALLNFHVGSRLIPVRL